MESPLHTAQVTPEEALFTVRFAYTVELLKDWTRHPVRSSRKALRIIRPILGTALILAGLWNLWLVGHEIWMVSQYYNRWYPVTFYLSYYGRRLFLVLLCLGVGALEFFMGSIELRRSIKRLTATLGPEPWPIEYRFGADRFTLFEKYTSADISYSRLAQVQETEGFILLHIEKNIFRLPKYAFAQGTPQELMSFLGAKVPVKK